MKFSPCLFALTLIALCPSCKDDPKLVAKREEQKAEITRLEGEIALIDEKLKDMPQDVSDQLTAAKAQAEKQNSEAAALETEIASLEAKKRALQDQFDAYRVKYQAK